MSGKAPHLSRRTFVRATLGAAPLLLAACSRVAPVAPANSPAAAPTPVPGVTVVATSASAAATPRTGGTLRAGLAGELTSIDGQQSLPGITATVGNAYEG